MRDKVIGDKVMEDKMTMGDKAFCCSEFTDVRHICRLGVL